MSYEGFASAASIKEFVESLRAKGKLKEAKPVPSSPHQSFPDTRPQLRAPNYVNDRAITRLRNKISVLRKERKDLINKAGQIDQERFCRPPTSAYLSETIMVKQRKLTEREQRNTQTQAKEI